MNANRFAHLLFPVIRTLVALALVFQASGTALAAVWTDQADYTPGSVVTISGDNRDNVGYLADETVHVDVSGPNGYTAACDAVADDNGAWSCQVTLWDNELAYGNYGYTATGTASGVVETGNFTDLLNLNSFQSDCNTGSDSFMTGATVCMKAGGLGSGTKTVTFRWWAPGLNLASDAPTRQQSVTGGGGNLTDSFAVAACGTWNVSATRTGFSAQTDTFTVSGCAVATTTTASNASATYGDTTVTLSATVSPNPGGGSVSFFVNGSPAGSGSVGVGGVATVSYNPSSLNAGSYTIRADFGGSGTFLGSSSDPANNGTLTIAKASSTTTVTCPASVTYDGSAQTPCSATVTGPGGLNQALTVSYVNNVNAGTATASASYAESANYLGSSDSENFTIDKAATTTTVTCGAGPFTYDGSVHTPCSAVVTGPGGLSESLTVSYVNNVNAGTATASASYAESANYLGSSDSENFTIDKAATVTTVTCGAGPFTYNGSAHTPCSAVVT
ncbi:MAG TPA: Ig-like domain-containing protein, partial [Anaerolineae bacterium]|nr:Ig-like domain-containing protein [Anaerolineae bacterium]